MATQKQFMILARLEAGKAQKVFNCTLLLLVSLTIVALTGEPL
jgi:hypothetical protein